MLKPILFTLVVVLIIVLFFVIGTLVLTEARIMQARIIIWNDCALTSTYEDCSGASEAIVQAHQANVQHCIAKRSLVESLFIRCLEEQGVTLDYRQ